MNSELLILVTGGTFDKEYDEINGRLFFKDTHVPEMLTLGRCHLKYRMQTILMMDSLDMSDDHRRFIVDACRLATEDRIVITHGTDTMEQTAAVLHGAELQKTIVLTGALVPYKFGSSDGLFNLGSALAFAQTLPSGVYVAMNGRALPGHAARKNRTTGVFE